MQKQYNAIVYRGRFQGLHDAHVKTILMGLELAEKVIVVIGSANEPRTYYRNPFFVNEREEMIRGALEDHFRHEDVSFVTVEDNPSDHEWASTVIASVNREVGRLFEDTSKDTRLISYKIGQVGFKKDENCVRDVGLFPSWEYVETPQFEPLDATQVREILFSNRPLGFLRGVCPASVIEYMKGFRVTDDFKNLMAEKNFIANYRKKFEGLEYAPTFNTGDNVAIRHGKVLLVKRKDHPGRGLWALPAGFFNAADRVTSKGEVVKADKSVFDCAVRELFEETKATVTVDQLRRKLMGVKVFDEEGRDPRGRIITHAHAFDLDCFDIEVEAADDAEETKWFDILNVTRSMMYADHYNIVQWAFAQYYPYMRF
jgi:bifunctional NMN adenylyltransferase/nudix hydrolase